jgi:hypothetical protein
MSYADDVLTAIQRDLTEIRTKLGPAEFAAFDKKRGSFAQACLDAGTDEEEEQVDRGIATWLDEQPAVKDLLMRTALELFRDKAPATRAAAPQAPSERATASLLLVDRKEPAPVSANASPQTSSSPPKDGRAVDAKSWTPEFVIQAIKEIVTAIIGLILVVVAVWLIVQTVGLTDHTRFEDARAILDVLVGLVGVVLGYYFGRIPAEARADQAQKQSVAATEHAERVRAKGEELGASVERALTEQVRGGGGDAGTESVRRQLSELRALTR